jgi:hypothetical protein
MMMVAFAASLYHLGLVSCAATCATLGFPSQREVGPVSREGCRGGESRERGSHGFPVVLPGPSM